MIRNFFLVASVVLCLTAFVSCGGGVAAAVTLLIP